MKEIIGIIAIPILAGLAMFIIPSRTVRVKGILSVALSLFTGYLAFTLYRSESRLFRLDELFAGPGGILPANALLGDCCRYVMFNNDPLAKLINAVVGIMTFLIILYSLYYIRSGHGKNFYSWFLITTGCAYGAVLSDNLLLFLGFWGILGMTLYKLIRGYNEASSAAAKKTLILIGGSDSIMIIGIALLWMITGSLSMKDISISTTNGLSFLAFASLLVGSFTKAGAFPFHTWVPDYAANAPASSSAYLPASLDKLLGIYFLARITTDMFIMNDWLKLLLLSFGVITIITAVLLALVQHNYKRLLGYHAVSQVGYMIMGFGLGSTIGVAAGLFHMINHALYKSGLFLSAGSIEHSTGKEELEDLGGLSASMPVTFFTTLIFAMSISGIPPLNGFASKWMIYQGIIEFGAGAGLPNKLWFLWLALAAFGSALTLASFIKLVGGIFLGRRNQENEKVKEVSPAMWIPSVLLAAVCIFFGVVATNVVVPALLIPVSGEFSFAGFWNSPMVSILVLISIVLGILVYFSMNLKKFRTEDSFIGGEKIQDETGYATTEFYKTILEFNFFSWMYRKAEEKWFDVYDLSKRSVLWFSHNLSEAHTGVLTGYILWAFAGLIIMLLIML